MKEEIFFICVEQTLKNDVLKSRFRLLVTLNKI